MIALRDVLGLSGEHDSSQVCRIPSLELFPDVLLKDAVSPGLILPGLLPKWTSCFSFLSLC